MTGVQTCALPIFTKVEAGWWAQQFKGEIDLIAGGPPCQGFSVSGKRQHGHVLAQNQLVKQFLQVVEEVQPRFVLIENVSGFRTGKLNGKERVFEFVMSSLAAQGFECQYAVLQALDYGVPSLRSRLFIVGSQTGFQGSPFPQTTHSRDGREGLRPFVSVEAALSDLPKLAAAEGKEDRVAYKSEPKNSFQREMRTASDGVYNHVAMKHSPRLVERFHSIQPGSSAYRLSNERDVGGVPITVYKSNNQKLRPELPSLCITANFQSTYVHYRDDRNLTAREAARLMTFPDSFVFCGKRTQMSSSFLKKYGREHENHLSQYNQIGNAVPPMLGKVLGECLGEIAAHRGRARIVVQPEFALK